MTDAKFGKVLLATIPPLVHLIRSEIRAAAPGELTVPQFRVLSNIRRGLQTVSEIAELHGVSQPGMTKTVNGLVNRGLVQKTTNPQDERQTLLTLTETGARLHRKTWSFAQKRIGQRLRAIPPRDRAAIIRALTKLGAAL